MPPPTTDEDLARLLHEANLLDEADANDLKFEQPTYQQLRLEFTRKSKKALTDGGNTLNTRRKRRKKGKPNVVDSREENKENVAASLQKSAESFLQEWHDDEVEIADYRSSDDSQDEQLEEWYKDLKGNKVRDSNLPPAEGDARKVGPVIRHESSDEEKSWLQNDIADTYLLDMMAKYPAGDNPREIVFDDLVEPRRWIERTHLVAENVMLMQKNRVFTILRQNRPRNLLAHLRLGYCVTYNAGRPACQQEGRTCALQCHICGVCCHMYSCTCRLVKRFHWCAHIHAAVLCGGNKFKNDQQVYVHISSRYTQLSHLRATCFDMAADVKPVENNEDAFAVMGWTTEWTPFSVLHSPLPDYCHICPQYKRCPECSVCRHQYLCACAEYMVRKRLCEHCHVVAIFLSENRVNTLRKREFRYLSDVSDDTDEEADPKRDISPIMLPVRKLKARHESSYSIPFKRIQVARVNDQLVYFVRRCDPDRRFVVHSKNRGQCACSTDSTSHLDCNDCKICRHYLTCNCGKEDAELCKHTHAVRRYIVRSYTPAASNVESALENVVRKALNGFYEGCDTAEIDCGPLLATDENINAVVENLKAVLGCDVELQKVDELSFIPTDSVKSRVYSSKHILDKVDQVCDPKVENCEKMHSEAVSCAILNNNSSKNDAQVSEPVSEGNDNSDLTAVEECDSKSVKEIDERSFPTSNSSKSVSLVEPALVESSVDDPDVDILAEMEMLNLSSNSEEKSENSLKPVFEPSINEDSLKAGESATMKENSELDKQLLSVQKTDFISTDDSQESESQAKPLQFDHLNSKSTLEHCVDNEVSAAEEIEKMIEVNSCTNLDATDHSQLNHLLKNGDDGVDASEMAEDAVETNRSGFPIDNSAKIEIEVPILQNGDSDDKDVCEEYERKCFAPLDLSSVKTLRSFYDLEFEPVLEIRYKANADNNEEHPKVLAETSRCVVTVTDSKQSAPPSKAVLRQDFCGGETKEKDNHCVSRETIDLSWVSKNLELCSIEKSAPNMNAALLNGHSCGSGMEEACENRFSTETRCSSLVKDVEATVSKDSVVHWEPVYIDDVPCSSGAKRKDKQKVLTEACAPRVVGDDFEKNRMKVDSSPNTESDFCDSERTFSDFDSVKDDEYLIPKGSSGFTNFGKMFKQKSLNLMRKLNLVKDKDRQKEETSPSTFFGNQNWTRSRRQREMAFLQSITDEFSDTDVYYV